MISICGCETERNSTRDEYYTVTLLADTFISKYCLNLRKEALS